jgi:ribosomal protein S18 acetylase RimI-like enzyme
MTHAPAPRVRPARDADMRAAFAVFRRSIMAYVQRLGIVESAAVNEVMLDVAWTVRGPWIEHLWRTATENWIAEDADRQVVGWAMSIERGGLLELTHFFVDPDTQARGLGRALLEKAFPVDRGEHRSIVATHDPPALSLYLRSGVRFVTTVADFEATPRPVEFESDLRFERLEPSDEAIELVAGVEAKVLGHRREIDTRFLLEQRPAWAAWRNGTAAGFAFGARGELTGPIGALEPADIPALLAHVESEAAAAGAPNIYFSTPLANDHAVRYLLARGFRLDPFLVAVLADDLSMRLDRWIHTGLSYIL